MVDHFARSVTTPLTELLGKWWVLPAAVRIWNPLHPSMQFFFGFITWRGRWSCSVLCLRLADWHTTVTTCLDVLLSDYLTEKDFFGSLKWWLSGHCVDKWEQEGNALPSRHLSMWLTGTFIDLMRDKLHYIQSDCTDHPAAWMTFLLVLMKNIQPNCRMTVE